MKSKMTDKKGSEPSGKMRNSGGNSKERSGKPMSKARSSLPGPRMA